MTNTTAEEFSAYVAVVRRLRKECPWDREQTPESLRPHLIEEAYEAVEAIDAGSADHLCEELGDLQLHIALHAVIAEETGRFSLDDLLRRSREKLVRRHPHVFGQATFTTAHEVKNNWEKTKLLEGRQSATHGLPKDLPALLRAYRLQDKVSKLGFDWKHRTEVWQKVEEEMGEVREAAAAHPGRLHDELGDLLFAVVNYARHCGVHPEEALRSATTRFERRFQYIEGRLADRGTRPSDATMDEMDRLWEESKRLEQGGADPAP